MVTKLTPKSATERSNELIVSWRKFAPELTLAGRTLAQFEAEKMVPAAVQAQIDEAKATTKGLISERDQANAQLKETVVTLTNAVRGSAELGLNSNFYRSLGFITANDRKRPVRKATPPTASNVA
jgi:hypothetical protein